MCSAISLRHVTNTGTLVGSVQQSTAPRLCLGLLCFALLCLKLGSFPKLTVAYFGLHNLTYRFAAIIALRLSPRKSKLMVAILLGTGQAKGATKLVANKSSETSGEESEVRWWSLTQNDHNRDCKVKDKHLRVAASHSRDVGPHGVRRVAIHAERSQWTLRGQS